MNALTIIIYIVGMVVVSLVSVFITRLIISKKKKSESISSRDTTTFRESRSTSGSKPIVERHASVKMIPQPDLIAQSGPYEKIYEHARPDLETDADLNPGGFDGHVFNLSDLGIDPRDEKYAGDVIMAVHKKIRPDGWKMATLSELLAYEAGNVDKHGYPLFAVESLYEHTYSSGELSRIPSMRSVPVIVKTANGGRKLDEYPIISPLIEGGKAKPDEILLSGNFLAIH